MRRKYVYVFDTTGSMNHYIRAVTEHVGKLATEILAEDRDAVVGFIAYGDHCDGTRMIQDSAAEIRSAMHMDAGGRLIYYTTPGEITGWLSLHRGTSGGDAPEAVECVLKHIADVHVPALEADDKLILVWFGDAPPHDNSDLTSYDDGCPYHVDWREQLRRLEGKATLYMAHCGINVKAQRVWDEMASRTGGISVNLRSVKNLADTMIAVAKREMGNLDEYAQEVRERGADAEMEEILVDLGATCYDK